MQELNPIIDGAEFIPLVRTEIVQPTEEKISAGIAELQKQYPGLSNTGARIVFLELFEKDNCGECWWSKQYTVLVYRNCATAPNWPAMDWLSIRRDDRAPVRDWRHMQAIKNQLCGPECEGVELYPDDARLVDIANQFHLWVFRDPELHFPFGMEGRAVSDSTDGALGAVQRPGAGQ